MVDLFALQRLSKAAGQFAAIHSFALKDYKHVGDRMVSPSGKRSFTLPVYQRMMAAQEQRSKSKSVEVDVADQPRIKAGAQTVKSPRTTPSQSDVYSIFNKAIKSASSVNASARYAEIMSATVAGIREAHPSFMRDVEEAAKRVKTERFFRGGKQWFQVSIDGEDLGDPYQRKVDRNAVLFELAAKFATKKPVASTAIRQKRGQRASNNETKTEIVPYTPQTKVTNLDHLPRGIGARYLEVTRSHIDGLFIAVQWRRKLPQSGIVLDMNANARFGKNNKK